MSNTKDNSDQQLSIVFFGAGPVASESLSQLITHFKIEAVVTKPQAKNSSAPVISVAMQHNLPTFTPANRIELSEIFMNSSFSSQVGVVIDFGIIIAADVFDSFQFGIVNSHFSLLPEWRGADPITFSILSGQKTTGVSLMRIVEALDEGPIIAQEEIGIPPKHNVNQLTQDLISLSTKMLSANLAKYLSNGIKLQSQEEISSITKRSVSYSKKINKADGEIIWSKPAAEIEREIRAYKDWPQSRCSLNGLDLIITEAEVSSEKLQPGQYQISGKNLVVGTASNSLQIKRLKPVGKNEMDVASFLAGYSSRL